DMLLTNEVVKVFDENVGRTNFNEEMSKSLVLSGLRPGVDTALFEAEASKARIDLMNTQKTFSVQQIILSELTGTDSLKIYIDTVLFHRLPQTNEPVKNTGNHPYYRVLLSQLEY